MSSQFLYTSMYSNTRDAFDYSVFSVPAVFPGPTTDNIICPPHPGNMSHCHPASGDGNAQYAGLYNQMNCFEHSAPLVGIRETFVPIFPAAAGFEMGAGDGAATSHVVSSDSAQATVPPGLVMADGPGLSQYSEPDPFPHIDPYILDLIATEAGMGGLNRAPWLYTPPGVYSAPTPGLHAVGQEINNTEQTNGASEDATESEGHTCLLAESSAARAYRLAQPRKSAKVRKTKKTSQRPRAPAIKATRPQVASKGPLRCQICDQNKDTGYAHQASLNRHIRTAHLDPSRWQCTLCDKSMIRSDALGRHVKKQHRMSDVRAKAIVAQVAASKYLTG